MSQMPDSIYLHKDSKYNTSGEYFAQDENRILYENEYDESVMEDYVKYIPIYRLEETVRKVEKDHELTIKDLKLLHTFLYAVKNNKQGAFTFTRLSDDQYQEVLKRFEEARK